MLHVGLVEGGEESVVAVVAERGVLHVGVDMGILLLFPDVYALTFPVDPVGLSPLQLLDGDGSVPFVDLFEFGLRGLLSLFLCEFGPDFVEE